MIGLESRVYVAFWGPGEGFVLGFEFSNLPHFGCQGQHGSRADGGSSFVDVRENGLESWRQKFDTLKLKLCPVWGVNKTLVGGFLVLCLYSVTCSASNSLITKALEGTLPCCRHAQHSVLTLSFPP